MSNEIRELNLDQLELIAGGDDGDGNGTGTGGGDGLGWLRRIGREVVGAVESVVHAIIH
jgi:hypothetical protein